MTRNTIRWGILGCGDVTEIKSGPGFSRADGSSLRACMRRDAAKAADYALRHNVPSWYDDADALINDPSVDAVYIATPPSSHKEYTLRAAAAGKPVYVEKPPAANAADLEAMIGACKNAGVPLFVAYYRRRLPLFMKVKELIDSGAIGTVRSMVLVIRKAPLRQEELTPGEIWRRDPAVSGGGLFVDLGSHQLDILDWILGPVSRVSGFAINRSGRFEVEDGVSAALQFESGVIATGLWDFTVAPEAEEDRIDIIGSKGMISFSAFAHQRLSLKTPEGDKEWEIPHPPHVQQPLIQSITDQLLGRGECPSTGETALRTSRVMDTLLADYYKES